MAMTAASEVVRTMCPMNCHPTFCGMLVEVEGGKLKTVSGDKDNPDSQGFLCVRGRATNEIFGNPRRLLVWGVFCQGSPRGTFSLTSCPSFLVRPGSPFPRPDPRTSESRRAQKWSKDGALAPPKARP
jgi:Molybdopterin oxidoreductase Fe4S4 domain